MMAGPTEQEPTPVATAARHLTGDLRDVFKRTLAVQGWALVVERQPRARTTGGKTGTVLAQVQEAQTRLKDLARDYLARLQPLALESVLAPADRLTNLANALPPALDLHLKQGDWTPKSAADCGLMVGALAAAAAHGAQRGRDFGESVSGWAAEVAEQAAALRAVVAAVVERSDGAKGSLAALQGRIDKTRAEIAAALDQLVSGGKEVGDGVRQLGTGLLKGLRRHGAGLKTTVSTKEDAEADKEISSPPTGSEADDDGEDAAFLVETMTGVGKGAEAAYGALQTLERANETLATLYLRLAAARADLAWARALADQADSLAAAAAALGHELAAMPLVWDDLAEGFQTQAHRFDEAELTLTEARALIATLAEEKQRSWGALAVCTTAIRRAMAGTEPLYPAVKA